MTAGRFYVRSFFLDTTHMNWWDQHVATESKRGGRYLQKTVRSDCKTVNGRTEQQIWRYEYRSGAFFCRRDTKKWFHHFVLGFEFYTKQCLQLPSTSFWPERSGTCSATYCSRKASSIFVVFQVEELVKEVQVLKAELRTRDKTIAQLTFQLQQQQEQMVSWCQPCWSKVKCR